MSEQFKVVVGFPFGGRSTPYAMRQSQLTLNNCTVKHIATVHDSGGSAGNFNHLWMQGLMAGLNKTHTHFAMLASDVQVCGYLPWIDLLIDEMERLDLALISSAIAIKDDRGLTSCGVGNPKDEWCIWRRFTTPEVDKFPPTFDATDMGYPGYPILHNNQLWVADLRKPFWYKLNEKGEFPCYFHFPERLRIIVDEDGKKGVSHDRVSEDWQFSRMVHNCGAKTAIHHGFQVFHNGEMPYPSWGDWGRLKEGDEETAKTWRSKELLSTEIKEKAEHKIVIGNKDIFVESQTPVKLRIVEHG